MNRDALVGLVKGLPTTYGRVAKTKVHVIAAVVIGVGILAAVLADRTGIKKRGWRSASQQAQPTSTYHRAGARTA